MSAHCRFKYVLLRYNFKSDPRNLGAVVILSADESTYTGQILLLFCAGSLTGGLLKILDPADSIRVSPIQQVSGVQIGRPQAHGF